jgi:hypothetical protein
VNERDLKETNSLRSARDKRVNCFECKHFYVTWDQNAPKGCRLYGFKSYELPSVIVSQSSQHGCLGFERRKEAKTLF